LEIRELVGERVIFTHTLVAAIPSGRNEQQLSLDFPFIGEFYARLIAGDGEQMSPEDYIFVNYPVFEETYQGVVYTKHSAVHEMPVERSVLPWTNDRNWYADTQATLIVTDNDEIHAQMSDSHTVMRTRDGGRTWDNLQVTKSVNTVLRDGMFLAVEPEAGRLRVSQSSDQGRIWQPLGQIESSEHPQVGGIEQLRDGSLIIPVGIISSETAAGPLTVHAFRSTDGGRTWSPGSPICPGGEPQILELQSGKLLAFCRNNPRVPPNDLQRPFRNEGPWRLWQRFQGAHGLSSYTKRITLAESDDGGQTWHSQRPATFLLEEMHGGGVQLPDGRVVFLYTHRGPTYRGGERAKVSCDEGRTWREELYFMTATPSYPGYSGSCVLPPHLADGKPGMILTLVGERSERNWGSEGPATPDGFQYMPRVQSIRWRPIE
jgi:Neuraminidase (sialidase)